MSGESLYQAEAREVAAWLTLHEYDTLDEIADAYKYTKRTEFGIPETDAQRVWSLAMKLYMESK